MSGGLGRFGRAAAADLALDPDALDVAPIDTRCLPWSSAFPVAELAADSVALASAMLARVSELRCGRRTVSVDVDPLRVAASFGSERLLRIDGEAPSVWAPLSGFWVAADGWVRTHGNYPHHAERLRAVLGLRDGADRYDVAAAIAGWSRFELEDAAIPAGAIVAAVRTADEWAQHPACAVLHDVPLIAMNRIGGAVARPWHGSGDLPLSGVRVLDLTRVIAGPVAARDLAIAGADVLRVDDPRRPEIGWQHLDTGQQKRTTLLDLTARADRDVFDGLLAEADVLVTGYRPGSLDRYGLDPVGLAATHPGLVVATVSAWGAAGPWAHRRGFDSIVQATIGIAAAEQTARQTDVPGALPVQALDHAAGHLLAAGVAQALARQRRAGGSHTVSVSLARVGLELVHARGAGWVAPDPAPALPTVQVTADDGTVVVCAPPPLAFEGAPATYSGVHAWGGDPPRWRDH